MGFEQPEWAQEAAKGDRKAAERQGVVDKGKSEGEVVFVAASEKGFCRGAVFELEAHVEWAC
jgi:hypothetical protein